MNRLGDATSPYLRQHADNPVHWWPWCDEALDEARASARPILLSVGYSACHWCHVMAHESFEDPAAAAVMNRLFVNIKVDREERPDLDRIYQLSHQLLTDRGGGWPLTAFLDPDTHVPFFAGTYFPPKTRYGMPGFVELLGRVAAAWDQQRDQLRAQGDELKGVLQRLAEPPETSGLPDLDLGSRALEELRQQFDPTYGGFGSAPKFPHPTNLRFLMEWSGFDREQRRDAWHMAGSTLEKMAAGGVYDHLAGGFCRYSVDDRWLIPHFEKMGYDNAQLLPLYAQAFVHTGQRRFKEVASEMGDWIVRDLQGEDGGYYSAWDADSEGEEGRYYLWSRQEVVDLLEPEEAELFLPRYGMDLPPNFEGHAWNPYLARSIGELVAELDLSPSEARRRLDSARRKLLTHRRRREPPLCDTKILTSWNGLMIRGMAVAGQLLNERLMLASARRALDFVRATLWREERLLAVASEDRAHLNGYLDDYAHLLNGTLALLSVDWQDRDLEFAARLADALLAWFEDTESGGFYFTSHDHEPLIQRPRPFQDDAMPAGNAAAVEGLCRLGHLLGEARYLESAERALASAGQALSRAPQAHGALLTALDRFACPPHHIVLTGDPDVVRQTRARLAGRLDVRDEVYAPTGSALEARFASTGPFTAYLCEGTVCREPVIDPDGFLDLLGSD
ncbi:MAG: thioredoxin domain-containing protein [Xanthomonadales bacterium]|nr:thioredoxin domain-containing protein [Xanthomonadales bacterium]